MTNLKKIGLTALAGSLAAIGYAQAGALSVNGTARMEYSTDSSSTTTTDAFAQNTSISFSGSGEMDNGMTVSYFSLQAGSNASSQSVALDMGDMGTLTMSNYNMAGIGTIQDKVPNGGEQPWDDIGTHGAPEQGVADPHGAPMLGYTTTVGGTTVSAAMSYDQNSPTTSIAVSFTGVEGLNVGAGIATVTISAMAGIGVSMGGGSVGTAVTAFDFEGSLVSVDAVSNTGIATVRVEGLSIKDEGSTVGTAGSITTINFVGSGIAAAVSGDTATVTSAGGVTNADVVALAIALG